ncbi:putative short-chain dehydrogenase/reductase family protein [Auriculariales sp. MPI-PUGE-AT-0066]|nr:putative short-chain dehydrogenase/reductase family protein [Auriculariales sp. MPI-PUGE-AT-0066]
MRYIKPFQLYYYYSPSPQAMPFFQPHVAANPAGVRLEGKTAIVTGANSGIGFETARQLLEIGISTVVLAVRNLGKGELAKHDLLATTSATAVTDIRVMQLDVADVTSVIAFVKQVSASINALDILVLNAGLGMQSAYSTVPVTGHELIMQVNYHSNALLIFELLPLLEAGETPSRITWVGSRMLHSHTPLRKVKSTRPLAWLDPTENYKAFPRYSESKLVAAMFMYEFAKRVDPTKVQINMLCPGMVITNIENNETPFLVRILVTMIKKIIGRTAGEGARIVMHAAVHAGIGTHGEFLGDATIEPVDEFIASDFGQIIQRNVWTETLEELLQHVTEERKPDIQRWLTK